MDSHSDCEKTGSDRPPSDVRQTLRVILLGKTGCGKSSVGNALLGTNAFEVSHGFSSGGKASKGCARRERTFLEVVDTPGLFDTGSSLEATVEKVVEGSLLSSPGLHVILFVVSLTRRFTEEDSMALRLLRDLFHESLLKYTIVVFTGGDYLAKEGRKIEEVLDTAPRALSATLRECQGRYVVFDNTGADRKTQADELLRAAQSLKDRNRGQCFPNPYKDSHVTRRTAEVRERLRRFLVRELRAEEAADPVREEGVIQTGSGARQKNTAAADPGGTVSDDFFFITVATLLLAAYDFLSRAILR